MEAAIDLQVCREQSFKFLDLFCQQVDQTEVSTKFGPNTKFGDGKKIWC